MSSFVSLYAGAGGMDLGFVRAGFTAKWANEIEPLAVKTYNEFFDGHSATCGDLLGQLWQLDGMSADLVIGGPPCQGFSVAGRMDPSDPRSLHVRHFMQVVEMVRPRAFVMENVKSLAVNDRWDETRNWLRARAELLGYDTRLYLLNASHFDVPQTRERMFLVGLTSGLKHVAPRPVTVQSPPTVRSVLATLPSVGSPGNAGICSAKITRCAGKPRPSGRGGIGAYQIKASTNQDCQTLDR